MFLRVCSRVNKEACHMFYNGEVERECRYSMYPHMEIQKHSETMKIGSVMPLTEIDIDIDQ